MEEINSCPICDHTTFTPQLTCKDYTSSNEIFEIKSCNNCRFFITSPRPTSESIGKYYISEDYISHAAKSKDSFDLIYNLVRKFTLKWKFNIVKKYTSVGSILDYGCGTGTFLNQIKKGGYQISGLEPSPVANQISESLLKQPIFTSTNQLEGNEFDIITLWHVLEHVHELNNQVIQLSVLLKTNGKLIIAVPNHNSPDASRYDKFWAAYDLPRHLWHFTENDIKNLASRNSLKVVDILPMKLDTYYVSILSEKYLNDGKMSIVSFFKGIWHGFISNIRASGKKNYSSLIYILEK